MPDDKKKKGSGVEEMEVDAIFGPSDSSTKSASPQRKDHKSKIKKSVAPEDPLSKASTSKASNHMSNMFAQFVDWMNNG